MSEFNEDTLKKYIIDSLSGIQLDVNGAEYLLERHKLTYDETKENDCIVVNLLNMDPNHFENSKNNCFNIIKDILNQHLERQESSSSADSDDSASENSDDEDLNQKEEIEILIPIYQNNHYCTCSLKFVKGEKITYEIIDPKGIYNNEDLGQQIIKELQKGEELNEIFKQYSKSKKDIIFESSTEYSERILQKQYDGTSCGYYMVATINDIVYEENMGVISKNEVEKQIKPNQDEDKKLQKKVLEYLDIEDLIKFYGNCVEQRKTKTQPDLDFLFEMVNNENIQDNCYNITINDNEYSIISLNGNQYFIGENNKIYRLLLDKENIEFEEYLECNEEIINYINEIYFNSELKKTNIENLNQIKKEDFYKEFVYSVIKNNFNDDEIKKGIIKAIPKNMRINFLKELGKEKNNENSINENSILNNLAKILNINIERDGIDKIVDTITLMCYDLNKNDIKEIFEIKNDNKFYEELYNKKNNQENKKGFIYHCILKSNNIEGIKSELINNFDNFVNDRNDINEEECEYDNIKDHKLEDTEDLKKILNNIEFKKEFKAKNPNKSILDIYNYYNKQEYIIKPKNIELSINDFYFGDKYQYNTNLLLHNNNLVIVDAGNTEGTFSGDALNGACREAYNLDSKVEIFKLEKNEEKNGIKCLKQIEKNVCSILEITKNKQTYKMIYLTGPVLSGNNDIKNLDNALNAYLLRALQDENLNDMTVLFSGISNNLYAGNYKKYIHNYNGNNFNIVEFYTALYFKIHSSDLEKKKCNIIYTNGISHAMDYIDNVLKVNENKISIDEILNGFGIRSDNETYTTIEDMLKKSNFAGIDYTIKIERVIKQNDTELVERETNIPIMENYDIHIGNAQREIIDSIRNEIQDNSFDILTLVNPNNNKCETKTLLDLEKECYTVIEKCNTTIKKQTDLYIIANIINETIKKEKEIKKEDANVIEVLDISCKEILNNEQYKKNHSSMRCNNVKFDGQSLSFHISHGGCKDANIKFNVPQGFSKEQVFVLIGCYGLNSVIKTFNKEGNCEIDYNGKKYNNVSEIESDNILKKSFEFAEQSKLQDLQNALNDFEEIGIGQSTTQIAF